MIIGLFVRIPKFVKTGRFPIVWFWRGWEVVGYFYGIAVSCMKSSTDVVHLKAQLSKCGSNEHAQIEIEES